MSRVLNSFKEVVIAKVSYRKKAAFLKLRKSLCTKKSVKTFNAALKKKGYSCKFVEMKTYTGPQPAKPPKKPKFPPPPPVNPGVLRLPSVINPRIKGNVRIIRPTSRPNKMLRHHKIIQPKKPLRPLPPRRSTPPQ